MPQSTTPYLDKSMEELEDEMGLGASMEFVDLASRGRNEYGGDQGELDLDELLDATTGDTHDGDDDVNAATGFLDEANELQLEMVGMHAAIFDNDPPLGGATARPVGEDGEGGDDASKASKTKEETDDDDEEAQVEQLEVALAKMHAIRDMPAAQRRKYAAQAFRDALRSL
ncbi:MAG: hypothetical protein M1838_004649 [Thelocarpon superellum]|nr:MAG: hypothetical protein M1838_004649 [Thelocarpon superellum]